MNLVASLDKREQILLSLFVLIKLSLIFIIPFTGDEAYFTTWANDLSLGYYDHPPMVGWGIYLLSQVSDHYYFYRLFSFLTSIIAAMIVYQLSREISGEKTALFVALVFFISPISLMMSLISNDIFLMFFGTLGAYYFYLALRNESVPYGILAGTLLGLAFLSKYFAVFLILGLFAFALARKDRTGIKIAAIATLPIALLVFENLYFNYQNCWNNVLFNFQSRVSDKGITYQYFLLFIFTLLLLVPPKGIYLLLRSRLKNHLQGKSNTIKYALYALTPALLVFLYVSLKNQIGLHWLLLFIPFVYLLFSALDSGNLKSLYTWNFSVSLLSGIVIISLSLFHKPLLGDHKIYYQVSLFTQTETICSQLPTGQEIYTLNYTNNSMLSYFCKGNSYHVLFDVSKYGREDDKHIDIALLAGKNLTIFAMHKKDLEKISAYFDSLDVKELEIVDNSNYYLVTANNFNFAMYRENILMTIAENFYNIPDWLPAAQCSFKEKYSL
ncbi:ArnT family glycosyltransferase [Kaarinaea lacus]